MGNTRNSPVLKRRSYKNPIIYAVYPQCRDVSHAQCNYRIKIIYYQFVFSPLSFPSLFSKSIRSPLNDRSFAIVPFAAAHLFLIIQADTINRSMNCFRVTDVDLVQIACESARLCEIIWLTPSLLKHHFFRENLIFHRLLLFYYYFFSQKKY